jgi:hypothetical protein
MSQRTNNTGDGFMTTANRVLALVAGLSVAAFASQGMAQNPKQGDYYAPGQTVPQQVSPGQEQQIREGDYYAPGRTTPQQVSPAQEQLIQLGDYYKPNSR